MIALYIRLSEADGDLDGDKAESNSVTNQRRLLSDFVAREPELSGKPVREFIDDGFTGSNFDARPAFNEMMDEVRAGAVECVVVKDLSRFGRDYVDAGRYIEQVLPFMHVRFIAVGDGYDSASARSAVDEALDLGLRNIMNANYSRELSAKIKAANMSKWKRGKHINSVPLFGYAKDPEDSSKLIIDEEAAGYVRTAFELACQGMHAADIAREMNVRGIPGPGQYKMQRGIAKAKNGVTKLKNPGWDSSKVCVLLRNVAYTGTLVGHKEQVVVMARDAKRRVPKEEQIITENAHPAIVSNEVFERAQAVVPQIDVSRRVTCKRSCFTGLVRCPTCHESLNVQRRKRGDYYMTKCTCERPGGKRYRILRTDLEAAVAEAIAARKNGKHDANDQGQNAKGLAPKLQCAEAKLAQVQQELESAKAQRMELYERYASEAVSRDEYLDAKTPIDERISVAKAALSKAEDDVAALRRDSARVGKQAREAAALADAAPAAKGKAVDDETVRGFVKRIEVWGPHDLRVIAYDDEAAGTPGW